MTDSNAPSGIDLVSSRGRELRLRNPVIVASGCGVEGDLFPVDAPRSAFGALVTPTVIYRGGRRAIPTLTPAPSGAVWHGSERLADWNHVRRSIQSRSRLSNDQFVILSVSPADSQLGRLAAEVDEADGIAAVEINGANWAVSDLVSASRTIVNSTSAPVFVKLFPAPDLSKALVALENEGVDGFTLAGSTMAVCSSDSRSRGLGRLVGPATFPSTLAMLSIAAQVTTLPRIASGGVFSVSDAAGAMRAGAFAVQIGMLLLVEPRRASSLAADLAQWSMSDDASGVDEPRQRDRPPGQTLAAEPSDVD